MGKGDRLGWVLGLTRIAMGFIFLWAFLDKTFGLGFSTLGGKSWIAGGSPTSGFLAFAVKGPFASFYHILAGNVFVDWIFMIGLLFIGISLILGIFNKLSTYSGSILLFLMYSALLLPENNPVIDDHIIYILLLFTLYYSKAGENLGLSKGWKKTSLVKRFPILE